MVYSEQPLHIFRAMLVMISSGIKYARETLLLNGVSIMFNIYNAIVCHYVDWNNKFNKEALLYDIKGISSHPG